jgi:hypothetical protein
MKPIICKDFCRRTLRSVCGRNLSSNSLIDSSAGSLLVAEIIDDTFMQLVIMNGTAAVPADSTCVNGRDLSDVTDSDVKTGIVWRNSIWDPNPQSLCI